jgi:hypothetical protein
MAQSCGYPDTMNKKESYSPLKKKKKPNKDYDKLADLLSVDTAKDTIIGPSKSYNMASNRGLFFEKMKKYDSDKGGPQSIGPTTSPQPKRIKNKRNTEYYTIHKK